jgi:hypothetical protein
MSNVSNFGHSSLSTAMAPTTSNVTGFSAAAADTAAVPSGTAGSSGASGAGEQWPLEVRCLLDSLARPALISRERRARKRIPCRIRATCRLLRAKQPPGPEMQIYLRNYDDRGVGFMMDAALPLGELVELNIPVSDGTKKTVRCRVHRCRQFSEGWFEGALLSAK